MKPFLILLAAFTVGSAAAQTEPKDHQLKPNIQKEPRVEAEKQWSEQKNLSLKDPKQEVETKAKSIEHPGEPIEAKTAGSFRESLHLDAELKMSETVGHRWTYAGVAVQAVKTDSPLQLINPLAPHEYGFGEGNAVYGLGGGNVTGWKFLAIKF